MKEELIAPCGMNCALCSSYLAFTHNIKNKQIRMPYCTGCRPRNKQCAFLKKRCLLLLEEQVKYCYECSVFPCNNLSRLDQRYRAHYRMSMIENLENLRGGGIDRLLKAEEKKWQCPGCKGTVCCHNGICYACGLDKLRKRKVYYRWEDD